MKSLGNFLFVVGWFILVVGAWSICEDYISDLRDERYASSFIGEVQTGDIIQTYFGDLFFVTSVSDKGLEVCKPIAQIKHANDPEVRLSWKKITLRSHSLVCIWTPSDSLYQSRCKDMLNFRRYDRNRTTSS